MSAAKSEAPKLNLFISYSRADSAFADELVAGLEYDGQFNVALDRHSIIEGEDWKKRLGALIADADTVVFILSPDSAQSATCSWEASEAQRLSKRILPVLARSVGAIPVPPQLAALNYVRFDEGRSFMAGLVAWVRSLQTDVDWLREHTRLLARAMEWEAAGRQANRMLAGNDIAAAKAWAARRPREAPEPTELHLEYIRASDQAEANRANAERKQLEEMAAAQAARAQALADREVVVKKLSRRTALGLAGAGTLTAISAGLAYWGVDAEARFRREQAARQLADKFSLEEARRLGAERTDIEGQVVAYAASPGQLADDGPSGGNSPYTKAVLATLSNPNTSLQSALASSNSEVLRTSRNRQRPYFATDLNGEIYLLRQPASRRRKAVVASVDRLAGARFHNVERDAIAWQKLLEASGFEVQRLVNPSGSELMSALRGMDLRKEQRHGHFSTPHVHRAGFVPVAAPPENTLAVFFLSGIGLYLNGGNYLAPLDADIESVEKAVATSIDLADVQSMLRQKAAASALVLDTGFHDAFRQLKTR
jgi:hypothetical protein